MTIVTDILNKAAFYKLWGAKVVKLNGWYPRSTFTLEVPRWVLVYEKYIAWVRYKKFCLVREQLKLKSKQHTQTKLSLPTNSFTFLDVAKVT